MLQGMLARVSVDDEGVAGDNSGADCDETDSDMSGG